MKKIIIFSLLLISFYSYAQEDFNLESIIQNKEKKTIQNCASQDIKFSGPVKFVKEVSYEVIKNFHGDISTGERIIETRYSFDKTGNLTEETIISKDMDSKTTYKYDDAGNFVEGQTQDYRGQIVKDIKLDEYGNCINTTYDNGKIVLKSISNIDSKGNKTDKTYLNGELFSTSTFTYDNYGNKISTLISVPSLKKENFLETVYTYDAKGRILKEDGIFRVLFKYDDENYDNWVISETYLQNGELQMITKRTIEYYGGKSIFTKAITHTETSSPTSNIPLKTAEQMPEFPNLFNYIAARIRYPLIASENGIEGQVVVSFVVMEDGSISNPRIKKSVDPMLDKEALRLIKDMPKWIPAKQDGKNVACEYSLPINFKLTESSSSNSKKKKK